MTTNYSDAVFWASINTVIEAGPMPEHIEDMPTYMSHWIALMRRREPRLSPLSNAEIQTLLNNDN